MKINDEIICFCASCSILHQEDNTFLVHPYDIMGHKEPKNYTFETIEALMKYIDARAAFIKKGAWASLSKERDKNLKMEIALRKKEDPLKGDNDEYIE